ncbi:MAG TPA: RNA helicase [Candidatus Margulisbacteria bacterium]|nr:MAG: RNA helicase [Candidatus Margulisbacteria bacterium GWD2_39_127]HAR64089.1 RNA helicase [Candidatus Margulisiibacteriota bacterium]
MSFEKFNLAQGIMAQVEALGYTVPTPIQQQAIPLVLEGRDVMGLAQTGTGKTAAFALPLLQRLLPGKRGQVRALIIAPTRELAEQINTAIKVFAKQTDLRTLAVYGGVSTYHQIAALRRGVDILVACPGRLLDHLEQRTVDLSHVETLVLDEADHMFDMGFLPTIRKILRYVKDSRQTLLFSATMPSDIRRLANDVLNNPSHIQIDHEAPVDNISHALFPVEQHLKTSLLLEILKSTATKSVLVFTRTKHRAKSLGQKLQQSGFSAISLQGNLSQNKRQAALDGFRSGSFQILVATDIAARGIDVSQISHVINYDIPDTPEAYTHRIGRTGRATRSGEAFTFVTKEERSIVYELERNVGAELICRTIQGFDYNAVKSPSSEFGRPDRRPMQRRKFASAR